MSLREALLHTAERARVGRGAAKQALLDTALARLRQAGVEEAALRVGELAPDFALPDLDGMRFRSAEALDRGPLALLFFRGGFCPYCRLTLAAYDEIAPAIASAGGTLVAISPERRDHLAALAAEMRLSLRLLFDQDARVARLFDLVFPMPDELVMIYRALGADIALRSSTGRWELPLPAAYVIDRAGVVRFASAEVDFTRRAEPADLLAAVRALSPPR